jgi:hypothetical protein
MPTTKTFTASNSLDIDGSPIITGGLAIGTSTEVATGLKVATGDIDVDLGNITVTTGNATITAGDLTVTAGIATAKALKASGLHASSNANGQARLVGSTANGAPTGSSYAYVAGDLVVGRDGKLWVCTSSGSPGSWTEIAAGGGGGGGTTSQDLTIGAGLSPYTETFNGSTAKTISLNLANENTWTVQQNFQDIIQVDSINGGIKFYDYSSQNEIGKIWGGNTSFNFDFYKHTSVPNIFFQFAQTDNGTPVTKATLTSLGKLSLGGSHSPAQVLDVAGTLRLNGTTAGTNWTEIRSGPTPTANVTYTLPDSAPASSGVLSSNSSGQMSWQNNSFSINEITLSLGGTITLRTDDISDTTSTNKYFTNTLARNAFSGGTGVTITDGSIAIGQAVSTTSNVTFADVSVNGALKLKSSSNGIFTLSPGVSASNFTLTLPNKTGTLISDNDTGTVTSTMILDGTIVNADISSAAAIAYSKLSLTGSIVNADVSSSAAIAYSKLSLTGSIVNNDIAANAAIAVSKLASSSLTVNGQSISLGGTGTITSNTSQALTIGTNLSGTLTTGGTAASTFNGGSGVTIALSSTLTSITSINGITVSGSSGTFALQGDNHYIGTTLVALNRASANLALTGITSVAMPSGSNTTTIQGSSSSTANYTLTLPVSAGANGQVLTTNGSGVLSWSTISGGGSTPLYAKTYNFVGTISTGTGTIRWYPDAAITITGVDAAVSTAPSGGSCVFVVKLNGTTTITTYTITSGNNISTAISVNQAMGITDYLTIDVTSANSAADGYVTITYTR